MRGRGPRARAVVAAVLVSLAASCTRGADVVEGASPTPSAPSSTASGSGSGDGPSSPFASLLTFDPADPVADPGGTGSQLVGEVDVLADGVVDFHGRGAIETPDRDNLDPGAADFEFGVRMRLTRGLTASNIMQKGVFARGQWKLSLHPNDGRPQVSCRVAGDRGSVHVFSPPDAVEDGGAWASVRCRRAGDTVDVIVDGELVASETGEIGVVESELGYWIGGKAVDREADPDQFLGQLDDAYLIVGPEGGDEESVETRADGQVAAPAAGPVSAGASPSRTTAAVTATTESEPVAGAGDAADDPAIWVHPSAPERSVLIGNDKQGALETYDLDGSRIERIEEGFFGNVDVRSQVELGDGGTVLDVIAVWRDGLRLYTIDPATRRLTNVTDHPSGSIPVPSGGEGLCLYHSPVSGLHAFVLSRGGDVAQYQLGDDDGDGLVEGERVRLWAVGSEAEGCVADDDGRLYVAEEDVGIWRYGAEPGDATDAAARVAVDRTTAHGGNLTADVEGLALVDAPDGGGYLIASAQAGSDTANSYAVYDRRRDEYLRSFRVVDGDSTDGCGRTDGIEATATALGPAFPHGVFVCQDNTNTPPGGAGNQNFKLVPLERVLPIG